MERGQVEEGPWGDMRFLGSGQAREEVTGSWAEEADGGIQGSPKTV